MAAALGACRRPEAGSGFSRENFVESKVNVEYQVSILLISYQLSSVVCMVGLMTMFRRAALDHSFCIASIPGFEDSMPQDEHPAAFMPHRC